MANPTILFNNGTGSDTAASGAGPGTAISGAAAAHTGGAATTTITLTNTPDLSGVAVDGSAVLWLKTSGTTRRFSKITAKDDGADTVTVEDSFTIAAGSPVDYAIGGKRKTMEHADSVRLFIADAKGGWAITLEDDQPAITASIACTATGDATNGFITLQGDSTTTRRLLTSATNNVSPLSGGCLSWVVRNLKFTSSAATKTSSYGILLNAAASGVLVLINCIFGDPTDKLQNAWLRTASAQLGIIVIDCEVQYCLGVGCPEASGTSAAAPYRIMNCWVHHNTGAGIAPLYSVNITVSGCLITNNGGSGIALGSGNGLAPIIVGNTIHGNTGASSDGISLGHATPITGAVIYNNSITANGRYGLNCSAGAEALNNRLVGLVDHNNYGNASDSTANTSGAVNGITAGASDLTVAPSYTNAAGNDYSVSTSMKAVGYPPAARNIGANNSSTLSYVDIGAAQRQEAAAGGGLLTHPGMSGGIRG